MLTIIDGFALWFHHIESENGPGYEVSLTQCKSDLIEGKFLQAPRVYKFEINEHDKPAARQESAEDYVKRVGQALKRGGPVDISIKENENITETKPGDGESGIAASLTFTLWQAPEEEGGRRLQLLQRGNLPPSEAAGADLLELFVRIHTNLQHTAMHEGKLRQLINDKNKALVECTNDLIRLVGERDATLDKSLQGITLLFNAKKRQIAELQDMVAGPQEKAMSLVQAAAVNARPLGVTITTSSNSSSSSSSSVAYQQQQVADILAKNTVKRAPLKNLDAAPAKRARASKVKDEPVSPAQRASSSSSSCSSTAAAEPQMSHTQRDRDHLSKMIPTEDISGRIFGDMTQSFVSQNGTQTHAVLSTQNTLTQAASSSSPLSQPTESSETPVIASSVSALVPMHKAKRSMYDSDSSD